MDFTFEAFSMLGFDHLRMMFMRNGHSGAATITDGEGLKEILA